MMQGCVDSFSKDTKRYDFEIFLTVASHQLKRRRRGVVCWWLGTKEPKDKYSNQSRKSEHFLVGIGFCGAIFTGREQSKLIGGEPAVKNTSEI